MATDFQSQLINKATSLIQENFSASEAAKLLGVEYRNMCAYLAGRKALPLKYAFAIFDYLDCRVVVFKSK